jgi:hypothetical protein
MFAIVKPPSLIVDGMVPFDVVPIIPVN